MMGAIKESAHEGDSSASGDEVCAHTVVFLNPERPIAAPERL